jgi:hypothetical protein
MRTFGPAWSSQPSRGDRIWAAMVLVALIVLCAWEGFTWP